MSDVLSQEELDALLGNLDAGASDAELPTLTDMEIDSIGEIGNISMGTAATTLFTLLNKKVNITTPKVTVTTMRKIADGFSMPSVLVRVTYKQGVIGDNLLVLKVDDVRVITDLMMGGDGSGTEGDISDMHLSAIAEAMNQMIGSSSTSLSDMLGKTIDITPPEAYLETLAETDFSKFGYSADDVVVKISFDMTIGDLVNSEMMQILPISLAKEMISEMMSGAEKVAERVPEPSVDEPAAPQPVETPAAAPTPAPSGSAPQAAPMAPTPVRPAKKASPVNASNVEFQNFDENPVGMYYNDIKLIEDVPLEITVELGKTGKKINEVLEFGIGTVVELDRLVGEHLDVFANGKKIAQGEVVVVDENYGVRITEIIASNILEH